ncbi:MAG: EthD domain-containing protein [Aquihabitans sp.]
MEEVPTGPVSLFAFVKRREGMTREEFLDYWHHTHGPLIRDTPGLGDRTLRYEQHPARPDDQSGWDGVAMQRFARWDDFLAMLGGEAGAAMRADEANFLDQSSIKVVFTEHPVVIVGDGPTEDA